MSHGSVQRMAAIFNMSERWWKWTDFPEQNKILSPHSTSLDPMKQIWLAMLTSKSQSTLSFSLSLSCHPYPYPFCLHLSESILSLSFSLTICSVFYFLFFFVSYYLDLHSLSLSLLLSSALSAVQLVFGTLSFVLFPKEPKVCCLLNRCFIFSVLLLWFALYAAVYSVSYRIIRIWVLIRIVIEI